MMSVWGYPQNIDLIWRLRDIYVQHLAKESVMKCRTCILYRLYIMDFVFNVSENNNNDNASNYNRNDKDNNDSRNDDDDDDNIL